MPLSDPSNIPWTLWFLDLHQPSTVIDVGAGAGKYGRLVRQACPHAHITALEVWAPYVEQYGLADIYDEVIVGDAREREDYTCDLVIFGDVLEHMTRADALALWEKARATAKAALISIPIIHYPQGEIEGNPFETHVEEDWSHHEVMSTFPGITGYREFDITATYVGEFRKETA